MAAIDTVIVSSQRKILVAEREILLNQDIDNKIFVLVVEEARGAAGGRAAGSGNRRIGQIYGFICAGDQCREFFQTLDQNVIDKFEIPYSAVAMDIRLSDGRAYVAQGVVDPDLVKSYMTVSGKIE